MPPFDDSDKTVADFDLNAFNKEMEEKKKSKELEEIEEIDEFDDIDEIDEVDEIDSSFDDYSPDFTDDLDDIDDDLFDEESIISRGLSELDENSDSKKSKSRKNRKSRKSRKGLSSNNPDKTMMASIDEIEENADDEMEEENSSEKTEIFSLSDFEEESSSIIVELAKIKVIEGANLEEYSIKQETVVIGRTENNDIMIPNKTISRNHCEITKTDLGFRIKDLNSGNGVKINNKKVSSKILHSGDVILIGKVKLQFIDLSVEQGGANESTGSVILKKRKPPKKKLIIISAVSVLVLLIVIVIFAQISKKKRLEKEHLREIALIAEKKKALIKKISLFYSRGIEAYKNKEWNSAITYFDRVLELKPDYTKAKDYKKFSIAEKKNKKLLKESEDLLLKDDYQGALLKLKNVKSTSSYYAEAQDRFKIAAKKHKKYRYLQAKKASDEEDYEKSLGFLNPLLSEYPDYDEAIKLKEYVDDKMLTAKKEETPVKVTTNIKFDPNKYKSHRRKVNKYAKGLNFYANKQFDAAIKEFRKLSAKNANKYAENVSKFKFIYAIGIKYLKLKNPSKGIKAFNKALYLDGKLGERLASDIKSKLAVLYSVKAKIYFASREYSKAYNFAHKALVLGNSGAKKVLNKLEKKSRDLYLSAYQKERRSPDSSRRDYKLITSILPSNNLIYQKAKKRLAKLKNE